MSKEARERKAIIPTIKNGHMAAPALLMNVDYSCFEQTLQERGKIHTAKKKNKAERKEVYGERANKYLNVPDRSIGESLHFTF